ncbi:MAG: Triosephosphate isomerase [Chlamydiae bacterium]|nr:Triosephosphate isomerase [Chlamydiota bacterium]
MAKTTRPTIIAGNWKMYKTIDEALQFVQTLAPAVSNIPSLVYLAVPFTAIKPVADRCQGTSVVIGAQNMNDASEGAFTGEIAGKMLKDAGARFVILGHSERRHVFGESSEFVNKKVKQAFVDKLQPILCVGETLQEREKGETEQVLEQQLSESLAEVTDEQLKSMVIAYEPVWAIGTGHTATPKQAQEMHQFCRNFISKKWGEETASLVPILYGGSVKPDNVRSLMDQPDIDGALVGGASLSADTFLQIVNYQTINVEI